MTFVSSNSYLQEGELVLIVLVLTFFGTIFFAKRASKKRDSQNRK